MHKKSRSKPYAKTGINRRNDKFSKNNSYIQRSKHMEESHRKEALARSSTVNSDLAMAVDLLPDPEDGLSESEFYDKLVSGYGQSKTIPILKENSVKTASSKTVKSSDKPKETIEQSELTLPESDLYKSFTKHFNYELTPSDIEDLIQQKYKVINSNWPAMGNIKCEIPELEQHLEKSNTGLDQQNLITKISQSSDLQRLEVKMPLCMNVDFPLSPLQSELLNILKNYQDLYYPHQSHHNADDIRYMYSLHALNHLLKSRSIILRNNEKVAALAKTMKLPPSEISIPDAYRDQGLKRMKILILVPFRECALKIINAMIKLLYGNQAEQNKKNGMVAKYSNFLEQYSGHTLYFPKTNPKPSDYEQTFSGNTDDNFKIGIRFTKKSMSLFSDMDSSDILVASPLALRMLINDKDENFDFLNSIELLIIDQAEILYAQNWENLLYIVDHMHLQPQKFPDTNCQRMRTWCLSGSSRFYRQTLLFSNHELPEFRSVFGNKCHNFDGKVRTTNPIDHGDIRNVLMPVQQIFRRINCTGIETIFDDRFNFFISEILPQFQGPNYSHCMLYVPSYFDYVRLRNHFKKQMISFVQISEYTKKEKISRARDIFFHSGASILLYSERAHFFRRTRIKGIRHLILYEPPKFPHFYSELINLMLESNQNPRDGLQDVMSVTILYSKFDLLSLYNIIGSENALKLTKNKKTSFMFSTKT